MHLVGSSDSGLKEQTSGHLVSGSYFTVLGVEAAVGRMLTVEDDALVAPPVAVISYNFWCDRFHLDSSVIGKAVDLNGTIFTIVGVAPREFFGERVQEPPDFWFPLTRQPQVLQRESWLAKRDVYWLNLMGRLKPGVTPGRAQPTLNTQLHQFYSSQTGAKLSPERRKELRQAHIDLKPGARGISWMRLEYSEPLHVLMAIVGLVLLIACANVATLLLARQSARRQELFVRLALGASRIRLIRPLLTESVLLALLGGVAGMALAWGSIKLLAVTVGVTSVVNVRPDLLVLGFTLGISILTGIAFGLVPALRSRDMEWKLGSAVRTPEFGMSRFNPAHALVVLQVSLSSVLLVTAGLLTHSLLALEHQNLGFNRNNVLLVRTDPRLAGYRPAELFALYRQIHDRLNALPGVLSASIARYSSLLLGRPIGPRDTPASPAVAVVSESFVRNFFPSQNPIGRHFCLGSPFKAPGFEIIGVAADSKYYKMSEKPTPMAYFSAWQSGGREAYVGQLLIRTSRDPSGAAAAVRRALHNLDARLPILDVTTLRSRAYASLHQQRMIAMFCNLFGLLALLLASIGLYGTLAYSVVRRTNEIGIRMALGAQHPQVLWMVLRESVVLVILGLSIGLPLALAATRWIKSFLFGVSTMDPLGISAAVFLMAAVSLFAGYLPARRATQVDPMTALRHE